MSEPPGLNVLTSPGPHARCRLEGWENLDLWANFNNPTWRRCFYQAELIGTTSELGEVDRLRLLAATLLHENEALRAKLTITAARSPISIILPAPEKK